MQGAGSFEYSARVDECGETGGVEWARDGVWERAGEGLTRFGLIFDAFSRTVDQLLSVYQDELKRRGTPVRSNPRRTQTVAGLNRT